MGLPLARVAAVFSLSCGAILDLKIAKYAGKGQGEVSLLHELIVLNETHLKRILTEYFAYYHYCRPHLSLDRNSPTPREVEPPSQGEVISIRQVGGLHHRNSRAA